MRIEIPIFCNHIATDEDPSYIKNLRCQNPEVYKGNIFITGCPRSGTVYMAEVLKGIGINVLHEGMGDEGSVGYHLVTVKPEKCLHQVRHPLKQMASMETVDTWSFVEKAIKVTDHELTGLMEFWLRWNEICESFCVWRYRVEDLENVWEEFLGYIGKEYVEMPDIPKNTNSRSHKDLTWNDLFDCNEQLAEEVCRRSIKYGYAPNRVMQTH